MQNVRRCRCCLTSISDDSFLIFVRLLLEKKLQTELKLEQIRREDGEEYIKPLDCLEQMKKKRLEIANILRELRQKNISNKYDCETKASREHLEVSPESASRISTVPLAVLKFHFNMIYILYLLIVF